MSPFTIFFLVVTFLYIIYYAVIITIDMNTKPKSENTHSETLDTEGMLQNEDVSEQSGNEEEEESTSQPVPEEEYIQEEVPDDLEQQTFVSPNEIVPFPEEDNPYGLTDEENFMTPQENYQEPVNDEVVTTDENEEPEVQIFEPIHENGGIAVDLNNGNEFIEAESLTPCKANMLADNVFDIVGIKRSFYGSEDSHESTLSDKIPLQDDEESRTIDKI